MLVSCGGGSSAPDVVISSDPIALGIASDENLGGLISVGLPQAGFLYDEVTGVSSEAPLGLNTAYNPDVPCSTTKSGERSSSALDPGDDLAILAATVAPYGEDLNFDEEYVSVLEGRIATLWVKYEFSGQGPGISLAWYCAETELDYSLPFIALEGAGISTTQFTVGVPLGSAGPASCNIKLDYGRSVSLLVGPNLSGADEITVPFTILPAGHVAIVTMNPPTVTPPGESAGCIPEVSVVWSEDQASVTVRSEEPIIHTTLVTEDWRESGYHADNDDDGDPDREDDDDGFDSDGDGYDYDQYYLDFTNWKYYIDSDNYVGGRMYFLDSDHDGMPDIEDDDDGIDYNADGLDHDGDDDLDEDGIEDDEDDEDGYDADGDGSDADGTPDSELEYIKTVSAHGGDAGKRLRGVFVESGCNLDYYDGGEFFSQNLTGHSMMVWEDLIQNSDYDYNDFVSSMEFEEMLNEGGDLIEIDLEVKALARGAGYEHVWQYNIDSAFPGAVCVATIDQYHVNGSRNGSQRIWLSSSGVSFPVFSSSKQALPPPQGYWATNAFDNQPAVDGDYAFVRIQFDTPMPAGSYTPAPYDQELRVQPSGGNTYVIPLWTKPGDFVDSNGYPLAFIVNNLYAWPAEGVPVWRVHPEFKVWADWLNDPGDFAPNRFFWEYEPVGDYYDHCLQLFSSIENIPGR